MKLVEPGYGPGTRFTVNGESRMHFLVPMPYVPFAQSIFASLGRPAAASARALVVIASALAVDLRTWGVSACA